MYHGHVPCISGTRSDTIHTHLTPGTCFDATVDWHVTFYVVIYYKMFYPQKLHDPYYQRGTHSRSPRTTHPPCMPARSPQHARRDNPSCISWLVIPLQYQFGYTQKKSHTTNEFFINNQHIYICKVLHKKFSNCCKWIVLSVTWWFLNL